MLKTLVPNGEESLSEVSRYINEIYEQKLSYLLLQFEVIQRTIAYIKYLQNILGTSEKQVS